MFVFVPLIARLCVLGLIFLQFSVIFAKLTREDLIFLPNNAAPTGMSFLRMVANFDTGNSHGTSFEMSVFERLIELCTRRLDLN